MAQKAKKGRRWLGGWREGESRTAVPMGQVVAVAHERAYIHEFPSFPFHLFGSFRLLGSLPSGERHLTIQKQLH